MSLDYENYRNGGLLRDRYLKVEDISEGAYGVVSLAHDTLNNNKPVAVKYITQFVEEQNSDGEKVVTPLKVNETNVSKSGGPSDDRRRILAEAQQEIGILEKVGSHPNIIKLYDSFDSYLILEYCSRGDLYEIIRSNCGPTSTKDIVDVMSQLIDAVTYAHSLGIYHRDIKPENILVTEDWGIKLTDWGLATSSKFCVDFDVGSERYMAPELFDSKNIESYEAAKCDIWSLGICLLNLVFGKNPFTAANQSDKLFINFAANREILFDIFPSMSYELFGVLRYSLTIDPDNRDLSSMRLELFKVRHLTLDYDLESYLSESENKSTTIADERSKSNPVITASPEKKLFRRSRKPLAIPSRRFKENHNGYNNFKSNLHQSYNRQEFFTPKSVFNNYMDKIDKNHKDMKDSDAVNNRSGHRETYYKKKNTNRRAWRKSYKKPSGNSQQLSSSAKNYDGGFLKPSSYRRYSPPTSQDVKARNKRLSAQSFTSNTGKYIPPSLRSPNLDHQAVKTEDESLDVLQFDFDDDEMFVLEGYQNSPREKRSTRVDGLDGNSKAFKTSTKLHNIVLNTPAVFPLVNTDKFLSPISMMASSSNGSQQKMTIKQQLTDKYIPPHHRGNSHSSSFNHRGKFQQQKTKRHSFDMPSSVPTSSKLEKINQKFNKHYMQEEEDEFNVNDMYHTFARLRLLSKDHGKDADVFVSDEEEDEEDENSEGTENMVEEFHPIKNGDFKFTARAIPSFTS